jgi:predicted nucleic acid-binding protein
VTVSVGQGAIVVDASVAVRFVQAEPHWLDEWNDWVESGAMILAPSHFGHEVANALLRSTQVGAMRAQAMLAALFGAGVEMTDRGLPGLLGSIELAEQHGLTVYDAAYLDLALDIDGALATLDRKLEAAAIAEGVEVVPAGSTAR